MDGVGVAKSLDCGEGGKVMEIVVGVGEKGSLESAKRQILCFLRGNILVLRVKCSEGFKDVLV